MFLVALKNYSLLFKIENIFSHIFKQAYFFKIRITSTMTDTNNPSSALTFEASQDSQNLMTTPHEMVTDPAEPYLSLDDVYEKVKLIWGTTININETIDIFKDILSLYYTEEIKKMIFLEQNCLRIGNLYELEEKFVNYPGEIIPLLKRALSEHIMEIQPQWTKEIEISFAIDAFALKVLNFRNLNTQLIDKIVLIKGIVLRVSPILPELVRACYICQSCNNTVFIEKVKNLVSEPTHCPCNVHYNYVQDYNKSQLIDKQILKIQEMNEDPVTVTVILYKDFGISPGDKVNILGILRASAILGFNQISNVFKGLVEGISVEKNTGPVTFSEKNQSKKIETDKNDKAREELNNSLVSKTYNKNTDVKDTFSPFAHADRYEKLSQMIAPSVYGHKDVKKALLLMLVGGITKNNLNATLRGNINILLAGDPGVAKSQMCNFINSISKGIYTSGNGSTAAGLSASVTRDVETGMFVLESGALTLSDHGVCIIDEFDKMNLHAQGVLHEAMEQQTISIAKAGIIASLNARCSVLASCNPKDSVWNRNKSIKDNISIVPTLLSRFDLIFILLDGNDPVIDNKMADFILNFYNPSKNENRHEKSNEEKKNQDIENERKNGQEETNSSSDLTDVKFISQKEHGKDSMGISNSNSNTPDEKFVNGLINDEMDVRNVLKREIERSKMINCTISREAAHEIIDSYISLRSKSSRNVISATTRQLDAIIRLSEAHCRIRMSNFVENQDVQEAVRLIKESMLMYAVDLVTGKIDIDLVSGRSSRERAQISEIKTLILKELKKKKKMLKEEIETMFGGIAQTALNELIDEDEIDVEGESVLISS